MIAPPTTITTNRDIAMKVGTSPIIPITSIAIAVNEIIEI